MAEAGRPTVMTTENLDKLRSAFSLGANDERACAYAGIGTTAFYDYLKIVPEGVEFAEERARLKQNPILKAEANINEMLTKPKKGEKEKSWEKRARIEASKWYLERKVKGEYSIRKELTGGGGERLLPVTIEKLETDYAKLADEIDQQGVEINPPVQDQGQTGADNSIPAEPDPNTPSQGEGGAQTGSNPQS